MVITKLALALFGLLYLVPLGISVLLYQHSGIGADWWSADRSSIGGLLPARDNPAALVRVFAAPTVRWRGILAAHCWGCPEAEGASTYTFTADGETAAAMIPRRFALGNVSWN